MYFFLFIVIIFEEVCVVCERGDDGIFRVDFGFCGKSEVVVCSEGDDRGDGWLSGVFVVVEGVVVEDVVDFLELGDGSVFEIDFVFVNMFG